MNHCCCQIVNCVSTHCHMICTLIIALLFAIIHMLEKRVFTYKMWYMRDLQDLHSSGERKKFESCLFDEPLV